MESLYKLHFNCGRQGELTGLFLEDSDKLNKLVESGEEVYFGEVLGKHSEICGPIEKSDFTLVTSDEKVISIVKEFNLTTIDSPVRTYTEFCWGQGIDCIFECPWEK